LNPNTLPFSFIHYPSATLNRQSVVTKSIHSTFLHFLDCEAIAKRLRAMDREVRHIRQQRFLVGLPAVLIRELQEMPDCVSRGSTVKVGKAQVSPSNEKL
jgi:hypothetical protein